MNKTSRIASHLLTAALALPVLTSVAAAADSGPALNGSAEAWHGHGRPGPGHRGPGHRGPGHRGPGHGGGAPTNRGDDVVIGDDGQPCPTDQTKVGCPNPFPDHAP